MATAPTPRATLSVPDRFEVLRQAGSGTLRSIIVPVEDALADIDARFADMSAAGRGALLLLRGDSGSGKSTFLDTIGLFRKEVVTERVPAADDIAAALQALQPTTRPCIVVLEGREALGEVSSASLEQGMHAINSAVRSEAGRDTLIVWPTNKDDLTERLVSLANDLGAEALFGVEEPVKRFSGPSKTQFVSIAESTVAALNAGASLAALGVSEEQAVALTQDVETIGRYLALIRRALIKNGAMVRELLPAEKFRMWTVVIAGNEPDSDVAALTRGGFAVADVDRLMASTGANVVVDLKQFPDQVGILGTVLDARIVYLDMVTVLAVARQYGDDVLHELMRSKGMSTQRDEAAADRLKTSELGLIMSGDSLGTRRRGRRPGSSTQQAFAGLADIARTKDGLCNRAIGAGLLDTGLIEAFETERDLGTELTFTSDLYCIRAGEPIRLEVMWRSTTGRAAIANYVLGKLGNYGRAIGLLR
jgi:energy-coupling factor transporter ATP-binding protein EcfA2